MKKPVLIRIPQELHDKLIIWSAELTVERLRLLSVPALIVELLTDVVENRSAEKSRPDGI